MSKKNGSVRSSKAHAARVRLFQILCALDPVEGELPQSEVELRFEELFVRPEKEASAQETQDDDPEEEAIGTSADAFQASCAEAYSLRSHLPEIDSMIVAHATGWSIRRMSLVDRTLIRLAIYECLIAKTVPVAIALSEAVLLAKEFGSADSPRFVNGVLARVVREGQ